MTKTLSKLMPFAALLASALFTITIIPAGLPASSGANKTLANLQAAYNAESNAHVRYLAFADKADIEGYRQVAVLFRACALAEHVHLTNHAAVIRKMGAEPQARIEPPLVRSTKENLDTSANEGEAFERDTIYPGFIREARYEGNDDAVRTFEFARDAEAQHARLFIGALVGLDQMKVVTHTYYVCRVCGYTTDKLQTGHCISCSSPSEKSEAVS